jgi:hypothetical protein
MDGVDDDLFIDGEIMGPSHGGFVIFVARGIGIVVALAVMFVSELVMHCSCMIYI